MKILLDDTSNRQPPFLNTELMQLSGKELTELSNFNESFSEIAVQYKELMMMYSCAIKEVRTKLDVLNSEYSIRYQRNPIEFITTRLKSTVSIANKLKKLNLPFDLETIELNLFDVAGIRVICSFVDDIYVIAKALINQDDITLVQEKDYFAHPKENGYRSLHLIVRVPVFFSDQKREVNVEVQIRTIAMDFWASLEHQLKYKQHVNNEEEIIEELRQCANTIADTDMKMLNIRNQITNQKGEQTKEERIMENLSKIDVPFNN